MDVRAVSSWSVAVLVQRASKQEVRVWWVGWAVRFCGLWTTVKECRAFEVSAEVVGVWNSWDSPWGGGRAGLLACIPALFLSCCTVS